MSMQGSAVYGFFTLEDLPGWLDAIAGGMSLQLWPELGPKNVAEPPIDVRQLVALFSHSSSDVLGPFLVGYTGQTPSERKIDLADGSGWKCRRDLLFNPDFIRVLFALKSDDGILSVMASTSNESLESKGLFRKLKKATAKTCRFANGFYFSESVIDRIRSGSRVRTHGGEIVSAAAAW